jgi:serine/threonine-protein phosphatase 2B catalytic subunit
MHYFIINDKLGKPDWKLLRDHLSKEGRIWKEDFIKLIQDMNKLLSKKERKKERK